MRNKDDQGLNHERILIILLAILAMLVTIVATVPSLRQKVKMVFSNQERHILAKVSGSLKPEGPLFTILKIKENDFISLEIYSLNHEDNDLQIVSKLGLESRRDAFFSFQGNATNLALTDVDHDGILEVVAPTYDDQMAAHLNVFKYNEDIKSFERLRQAPQQGH